jgi:acetoacetyl-CoA synthetase
VLGNPNLPVFAGESQCRSLALDVQAWSAGAAGNSIGELVCANPFPSRPLGFLNDARGESFHQAYFSQNPGVWTHGDLIEFFPDGAARLHVRSDGVLNVRGVSVGPAEIYRILHNMPMIRDALVVEQRMSCGPAASRIVLLLAMRDGASLTGELAVRVRRELARRASPAHVPDMIIAVDELPLTHSGKLSAAAARNAVNDLPVVNAEALRNQACLDVIRSHPALREAAHEMRAVGTSTSDLEKHLQALWEALFGFGPISTRDNFFELGGHSLLAARLLAQVRRSTGRALPLVTLLRAPTIAQLAAMIHDQSSPTPSATLVQLRAGRGRPLFIMHGITGTVMDLWTLANTLRAGRPIYGLQAHGLDGEAPVQRRVEEMAANYIAQMRAVQPRTAALRRGRAG